MPKTLMHSVVSQLNCPYRVANYIQRQKEFELAVEEEQG
jgi:hypothetical protein